MNNIDKIDSELFNKQSEIMSFYLFENLIFHLLTYADR